MLIIVSIILVVAGAGFGMAILFLPVSEAERFEKVLDGETLIVERMFRFDKVSNSVLREYLNIEDLDEETLEVISMFVHQYSQEGFLRYLASGCDEDYYRKAASVFVCYMLDLSYEFLYKHGHMAISEAQLFIDMIEASKV